MQRALPLVIVAAAAGLVFPAFAQSYEIGLIASSKNMMSCTSGDSNWVKKWQVTVAGNTASVSGGTPFTLTQEGQSSLYKTNFSFGGSVFTASFDAKEKLLKIVSKNLGCTWEGKA